MPYIPNRKFFQTKKKIRGEVVGPIIPISVEIPQDFWDRWLDMCEAMGYKDPMDPIEIHLDDYLRQQKKKRFKERNLTTIMVNVAASLKPTFDGVCYHRGFNNSEFLLKFMRKIFNKNESKIKDYFGNIG